MNQPAPIPHPRLSEDDFDAIINFLSESNVPILTAEVEDNECETLINIEGFLDFWRKIEHGEPAAFVVYSLGRDGSLFYHKYSYEDDRKYCTEASVTWNALKFRPSQSSSDQFAEKRLFA